MEPMFPKELLYGSKGHMRTQSLFLETRRHGDEPLFTLKPGTRHGCPSLRDLFIEYTVYDPSESSFAEAVFGEVAYWENLKKADWMQDHIEKWRYIADVKRKAIAFKTIIKEVENDGRNAFSAAKYLIDEPWKDKKNPKVKEEVKKTTEEASDRVQEDRLRLIEGGLLDKKG